MAVWKVPYHTHNVIFGLGGAMMANDSRTALMLARPLVERVHAREEGSFFGQLLYSSAYFAMGRFEDPKVVLELDQPKLPYLKAAWHYPRGEAFAFLGDKEGLAKEREAIPARMQLSEADEENRLAAADQMLGITRDVLAGRLAMIGGRYHDAAASFAEAALIEETEDFSRFRPPSVLVSGPARSGEGLANNGRQRCCDARSEGNARSASKRSCGIIDNIRTWPVKFATRLRFSLSPIATFQQSKATF